MNHDSMFNAEQIPADLRAKAKAWFVSQMNSLEKKHGAAWADNAAWLADYLNQELLERAIKTKPAISGN